MSNSLIIHLIFKDDVTEKHIELLTSTLDQSDNIRVYDYNKRTIKIIVLNKQKVNDQVFAQLSVVVGCRIVGDQGIDNKADNVYILVNPVTLTVDTSSTANAVKNLF